MREALALIRRLNLFVPETNWAISVTERLSNVRWRSLKTGPSTNSSVYQTCGAERKLGIIAVNS